MSLSAVVNIMFNKDKNIYLQESIEMDSISCYHNLQKFRSKCLFHGQICDHGHLKSHPVVIFRRTFPHVELSVLTLLIPLSPSDIITLSRGVHHFKIKIFSIGQSESTRWPYSTSIHIWPHLRHTRWRLLAALHLPFHVKSFWVRYV